MTETNRTLIEIGDRVTFRKSDSLYRTAGVVLDIEIHGDGGVFNPERKLLVVRDDRRGWVHRLWETECAKAVDISAAHEATDEEVAF